MDFNNGIITYDMDVLKSNTSLDDVGLPVLKPIGEVLSFLPKSLQVTLGGWSKWLVNGEESLTLTAEAIQEKIKKIPEEKLVEPEPYVAIPAIQQISYCQNSEELRELYANLLVASMNEDTKWDVHPAFVDIIKQLTPDEARYLTSLPDRILDIHPIIDVGVSLSYDARGTSPVISNFTNYNIDKLDAEGIRAVFPGQSPQLHPAVIVVRGFGPRQGAPTDDPVGVGRNLGPAFEKSHGGRLGMSRKFLPHVVETHTAAADGGQKRSRNSGKEEADKGLHGITPSYV